MISLTAKDLANAAGYTYQQMHNIDKDLPDDKKLFVRSEAGKYDLAMFVQRWTEYNVQKAKGSAEKDLDAIKAEHEEVKMEKTRLEVDRMIGRLVDAEDVKRAWGEIVHNTTQALINLPRKTAPALVMMENVEAIAAIIDKEITGALMNLSKTEINQEDFDDAEAEDGDGDDA